MKLKRTLALAALLSGAAGVAHPTEGWYGRADVGYSVDGEIEFDTGPAYDLDDDWMGALGAGYAFTNGFRLEGEVAYRDNEALLPSGAPAGFDVSAWSLMANLYYDFNRGGRFEPYLGLGVGAIDPEFNDSPPEVDVDPGFAWQAMAGVAIGLTPQLDLDIGYRYLQADDLDFEEGVTTGQMEYMHQAVTVGLRYQFAAAPPPPVAAPPPAAAPPPPPSVQAAVCPQSDFVVYFEWDRSNLNQSALETIDAAVARARECNIGGIVVTGHTDTSGSPTYNQGLSERRAGVVRDALVARGVDAGAITTQARGETDLAQQTRDGVREPLNRRTAVTISFR
jgi:outer membrane protein OmpA-like peptidoglycan-associated protein